MQLVDGMDTEARTMANTFAMESNFTTADVGNIVTHLLWADCVLETRMRIAIRVDQQRNARPHRRKLTKPCSCGLFTESWSLPAEPNTVSKRRLDLPVSTQAMASFATLG